jgi:hypothetical protein
MSDACDDLIEAMDRLNVAERIGHTLAVAVAGLECTDRMAKDGVVNSIRLMLIDLEQVKGDLRGAIDAMKDKRKAV